MNGLCAAAHQSVKSTEKLGEKEEAEPGKVGFGWVGLGWVGLLVGRCRTWGKTLLDWAWPLIFDVRPLSPKQTGRDASYAGRTVADRHDPTSSNCRYVRKFRRLG